MSSIAIRVVRSRGRRYADAQSAIGSCCLGLLTIMSVTTGCGRENPSGLDPTLDFEMRIIQGDGQAGIVGENAPDPLGVKVTTGSGDPAEGVLISFTLLLGDAVLGESSVATDANGSAFTTVEFGTKSGPVEVSASMPDQSAPPLLFHLSAGSLDGWRLEVISGYGQSDTVGNTLPKPLAVRVTDRYNNRVASGEVAFTILAGSGTLSPPSAVTDDSGIASVVWTLGPEPIEQMVEARLPRPESQIGYFRAQALRGAPAYITVLSGNEQRGLVGAWMTQGLRVKVTDKCLNPLGNVSVEYSIQSGSARLYASIDSTDWQGMAGVVLILGSTPGEILIHATAGDLPPAVFTAKAYLQPSLTVLGHAREGTRLSIHAEADASFERFELFRPWYGEGDRGNQLIWTSEFGNDTLVIDDSLITGLGYTYRLIVRYSSGFSLYSSEVHDIAGFFIQLSGTGQEIQYDPPRSRVYVSVPLRNEIAVLSAETFTLEQSVGVGEQPGPMEIMADYSALYIGQSGDGSVGVLNLDNLSLTTVPVGARLGSPKVFDVLQVRPNRVLVTALTSDGIVPKVGMIWTDLSNLMTIIAPDSQFGAWPRLAADITGRYAYIRDNNNRLYKLDMDDELAPVVERVTGDFGGGTIYFSKATGEDRFYLSTGIVLRADSYHQAGFLPPGNALLSDDGSSYYVWHDGAILSCDTRALIATRATATYVAPTGLAVNSDGSIAWLLSSDRVYVVPLTH